MASNTGCRLDISKLVDDVKRQVLTGEEMGQIVKKATTPLYRAILANAPYDKKSSSHGIDHLEVSDLRIYTNQAWVSIGFNANNWEQWKHLHFLNYDPRSEHWHWFTNAEKAGGKATKKQIETMAKALYDKKGKL